MGIWMCKKGEDVALKARRCGYISGMTAVDCSECSLSQWNLDSPCCKR